MAADHATPHFHNQPGVRAVRVGAKEFMCVGALPPFAQDFVAHLRAPGE